MSLIDASFRHSWLALAALLMPMAALAAPAVAEQPAVAETPEEEAVQAEDGTKFIRVSRDDDGNPVSLDTAIVRYASKDGEFVVDLIGAVHVGEKSYYKALNKAFEDYDVLLYELVAAPGTRIPKGGRAGDPISGSLKSMLKLESQVERIDYTKENFVHADLSPEQIGEKMRERGDTGLSLALSVFGDMMRQANLREQKMRENPKLAVPEVSLFTLLFDPSGPAKMKRMMAAEFEHMDELGGLGGTLNTLLVEDRNAAAVVVLEDQIKAGKKRIGIFYGAAHMPDFEKRLVDGVGLKRESVTWIPAWDLED